jgi:hypothetical protein
MSFALSAPDNVNACMASELCLATRRDAARGAVQLPYAGAILRLAHHPYTADTFNIFLMAGDMPLSRSREVQGQ